MVQQPLKELPLLTIEDAEFVFQTNFAGSARPPYDEEGDRYFNAKIDNEIAEALARDGWNIKWTKPGKNHPNPEEHVSEPYIVVALGFKFRAPQIILIRDGRPKVITEENVALLDSAEFEKVDITVRARHYEMPSGQQGYKAWLAEFYGHVQLSDLGKKYAHLLDTPSDSSEEEGPF